MHSIFNTNNMKRSRITYYACLRKHDNKLIVTLTKKDIASLLGVCPATIARWINNVYCYDNNLCTIWSGIVISKLKVGFAINPISTKWNISH
jgi:hypothetical protein